MRIAHVIFAGSMAALTALAAPALARHSDAQKATEEPTSPSPCHAYEMAPTDRGSSFPARSKAPRANLSGNPSRAHRRTPARVETLRSPRR